VLKFTNRVAFSIPHRISGFFEIVDQINGKILENPVKIGSRGAGFNVNAFGKTVISYEILENDEDSQCLIYINGEELNENAETSFFIFKYVERYIKFRVKVKIEHSFELPVGCGYGASGSGALGTIFGLNKLFNLNLTFVKCGEIAHIAEVINKTGLGTVCGQIGGGLCILKEAGYPCKTKQLYVPQNIIVISASFGKIATKSILSDPVLNARIKEAGRDALDHILLNPNYKNFVECSMNFVKQSKIIELLKLDDLKALMHDLNKLEIIGASMNQLGRSIYVFCEEEKKKLVNEVLESFNTKVQKYILKIYTGDSITFEKTSST
jgi:pantoate kinase